MTHRCHGRAGQLSFLFGRPPARAAKVTPGCHRWRGGGRGGPPPASPDSSARDDLSLWNWISDAWISLQTDGKNWRFARTTCSFSTTATVADYDYADMGLDGNFQRLWPCNDYYRPRAANASTNWALSRELSYDEFGATFLPGMAAGAPRAYTVTPDRKLRIGPTPDAAYTITIDAKKGDTFHADYGPFGTVSCHFA